MGTKRLTWHELLVVVHQSPPTSALFRSQFGTDAFWGLPEQLLASVADALHVANWQRSEGKRRDYPKPISRPGVVDDAQVYGSTPIPIDQMQDWLGWSDASMN